MRQHVPELDRNLSNDEFLDLIVDCFHSVIFIYIISYSVHDTIN